MSLYRSTSFSIKMILKNKQRTLTMALGIMVAIGLVIGVLGYIDYSQNEVISRAVQDIPIDMTAFQSNPSVADVPSFQNLVAKYPVSSFVIGSEFIEATTIQDLNHPIAIVPSNSTTSTPSFAGGGEIGRFANLINGTPVVLYGVNFSYFQTFSNLFRVTNGSASSFTNSTVFVSNVFADQTGFVQNDNLNLTLQNFPNLRSFRTGNTTVTLLNQKTFTVSGIVEINTKIFQQSNDAFNPPSGTTTGGQGNDFIANRLQRLSYNAIFMDINTFNSFAAPSNAISFGAFQLKIDHTKLSSDTTLIGAQISQLQNYIQGTFTQYTIISDLQSAINAQASQLDNLRLTLIYLTLPSIFIGFMLTKYATDLVLLERRKEITALRAKSLSQTQIRNYIVIESLLTSLVGTFLGIFLGYAASFLLNNFNSSSSNISLVISQNSIILALILGIGLAVVSGFYTANKIMKQSISEGLRVKSDSTVFWKHYYIDVALLGIGIVFSIFSIVNFNPIPGFAAAAFDLIVPLTTWIGAALFLVRALEFTIIKLEPIISRILNLLIGDLGGVITKNIVRKPEKFNQLTIILILVLSFGIVVGSISTTYQAKASQDASFAVGSDFRIDLPATDQLTYNTSDFLSLLQSNITDVSFTPVIVTYLRVGIANVVTIGIDPATFPSGAYFQKSFLQSGNTTTAAMQYLKYDPNNPKVIISNAVANPSAGNRADQGRFQNFRQNTNFQQFANFAIGGTIRAPINSQLVNFTISDISYYFPAIANILNQGADSLEYSVVDYRTLTQPLTGVNQSLISNGNATFILGTYIGSKSNFNSSAIAQEINGVYNSNFSGAYPIVVNTQAQYLAESSTIGNLLLDLANLELVIVLIVTIFSLGIYTTTTLIAKKKVFGTFNALGAKLVSIWYMITGEMLIGILYSIVISLLLGVVVSYTYLGFLSNLFILPYISLELSPIYSLFIYTLAILGLIIISGYAVQRVFRLEPVEALREL